ncbi:MAG: DUF2269 family protein [bacterium]|nr:DUF2269 family protein [bacterium]
MHPAPEGANTTLYGLLVFMHIVFAVIAIGYNFAYVIWIRRGTSSPQHLDFALRGVKFMDDYVANPCYIGAAITGFLMVFMGKPLASFLWVALAIYFVAMGVAYGIYTPLLSRQIRVLSQQGAESTEYQAIAARSNVIGAAMGFMVILIVALKIFEPVFWEGTTSLRLFGS